MPMFNNTSAIEQWQCQCSIIFCVIGHWQCQRSITLVWLNIGIANVQSHRCAWILTLPMNNHTHVIEHWHCFEAVCSTFFLFVGLAFGMIGNYALSGFVLKDLNDFKSHQKIKIWLILHKIPLCYFCFFNYFYYPKSKSFNI